MSIAGKKIIVIIPARGGSKGIPRKNIRFLAGKPLISYSIENSLQSKYIDQVLVSTDDDEISYIASRYKADVLKRPERLAQDDIPLDPVIHHAVALWEREQDEVYDIVITIQPTSPLLSTKMIDEAIEKFVDSNADTLLSVVDDRHLSWKKVDDEYLPNNIARKNRQYLLPQYKETGGIVITKRCFVTPETRFGEKIDVIEFTKAQATDIDDEMDWWIVEKLLKRRKILIRVDGYKEIGLGHIYRTLLLASRLIDHELLFVLHEKSDIGIRLIESSHYKFASFTDVEQLDDMINRYMPDIMINDILDTTAEYMQYLQKKNIFTVNFEDVGEGTPYANVVINALYHEKYPLDNHYWGKDYYCMRDEFLLIEPKEINKEIKNILISFGGTDVNDYTRRVIHIINHLDIKTIKILVIAGLGYDNIELLRDETRKFGMDIEILQDIRYISKYMQEADLAITSAGRTVYELASIGIPTIVLAQNDRELRHTFACADTGVINLGLGYQISDEEIEKAILRLCNDYHLRMKCNQLMLKNDLKSGVEKVLGLIFDQYEKFSGGK